MELTWLVYGIGKCCSEVELQSDVGVNEVAKGVRGRDSDMKNLIWL